MHHSPHFVSEPPFECSEPLPPLAPVLTHFTSPLIGYRFDYLMRLTEMPFGANMAQDNLQFTYCSLQQVVYLHSFNHSYSKIGENPRINFSRKSNYDSNECIS